MNEYDLVIRGGTVIDGDCGARLEADVAIAGGVIAEIGKAVVYRDGKPTGALPGVLVRGGAKA